MDSKNILDVIIIGGGIVGVGILRDLSLHGVRTLLVDKGDFCAQTSQSSSKMLHGGIRYLENFDFALVHEALHEKNLWLKLTPHLTKELPFHMPVYKESKWPMPLLKLGLLTYDVLSGFQNSPHYMLSKQKTIETLRYIREEGLRGSGVYYDAIVDDHKLGLECLYDALTNPVCSALNYTEIIDLNYSSQIIKVTLKDRLNGQISTHYTKDLVFATGPFTDQLLSQFKSIPWSPKLLPSKGIHLWLDSKDLPLKVPMVLQTADHRVIFVIPQRDAVLVGTTETPLQEEIFNIQAKQGEIDYLIQNLKYFFPKAPISESSIISSFAGVRPLVKEEGSDLSKTSREHKVYRPYHNMFVIMGGKYTTFRVMAQDVAAPLVQKHKGNYNPGRTLRPLRKISIAQTFEDRKITLDDISSIVSNEKVRTLDDLINRRLSILGDKKWPYAFSKNELINKFQHLSS